MPCCTNGFETIKSTNDNGIFSLELVPKFWSTYCVYLFFCLGLQVGITNFATKMIKIIQICYQEGKVDNVLTHNTRVSNIWRGVHNMAACHEACLPFETHLDIKDHIARSSLVHFWHRGVFFQYVKGTHYVLHFFGYCFLPEVGPCFFINL